MNSNEILSSLSGKKSSINNLRTSNRSGIYAIYHKNFKELIEDFPNNDGLVYIGKSTNLAEREFETHFNAGATGFSTVRRTIGALLKEDLKLKAIPRGSGDSGTNYTNYQFSFDGEEKISNWMKEKLLVSVYESNEIDLLETELISLAKPIFNLTGWDNPYRKFIKEKRKMCSDEARGKR